VVQPDGSIGLLYESGLKNPYQAIEFATFNLDWLKWRIAVKPGTSR
jgi:hypothetical protein